VMKPRPDHAWIVSGVAERLRGDAALGRNEKSPLIEHRPRDRELQDRERSGERRCWK